MTVYNELNKIAYIGDTAQTLYPIPFEYISTEDIKVSIYTSGNEFVENWMYSTQYVIEDKNIKILSGYEIDNTKKLLVLRKVDLVQDNKYREGGDFPAKSTETSFDKLTMITQQLQETLDRCVKVEVLDIQSPDELLQSVYDKLDSATTVAQEAVDAANSATQAVESAEKTLSEVTTYVDSSKSEINTLVTDATNSINTTVDEATTNLDNTISQAVNDVKAEAVAAAEGAIQDAANTAIQIATDHANTVIIPPLQEYVDNARESATSAEESSLSASASALSASQSASNASVSETNAKNSEISAKNSERVLQNLLPSQASNAGKFLTTDGVNAQWAEVVSSTITYWDE